MIIDNLKLINYKSWTTNYNYPRGFIDQWKIFTDGFQWSIEDFHWWISAVLARVFANCSDWYKVVLANGETGKTSPEIILFIGFLTLSYV